MLRLPQARHPTPSSAALWGSSNGGDPSPGSVDLLLAGQASGSSFTCRFLRICPYAPCHNGLCYNGTSSDETSSDFGPPTLDPLSPLGGEAAAQVQWKPPKNSLPPPSRRRFWFAAITQFEFPALPSRRQPVPIVFSARSADHFSAATLHCSLPIAEVR